MKILVCVKQVPDTTEVKLSADYTLERDFVAQVMNPADESALEKGLALRDAHGGSVTVLTMGPKRAEGMLREALSRGADHAVLLTDPAFAGADTLATARALKAAFETLGGFDVVLCGRRAVDGETGQVGPMLASLLDIPCIPNAMDARVETPEEDRANDAGCSLAIAIDAKKDQALYTSAVLPSQQQDAPANDVCKTSRPIVPDASAILWIDQLTEAGVQTWRCSTPAVITLCEWSHRLRLPTLNGLRRAAKADIRRLTPADMGIPPVLCGLKGSPTRVIRVCARPSGIRPCEKLSVEAFLQRGVLP